MIKRTILLALYSWFAASASVQVPGGNVAANAANVTARGPHVIETAAKATLKKDAIRLALPFDEPAGAGVRVVAWLLSPANQKSPETTADVKPGGREVDVALAWPKGSEDLGVKDVAWYRIGYRVEAQGAEGAHGILSIGAITEKLIALRLAYPRWLVQGKAVSARVMAMNPVTGKPLAGINLTATLVDDDSDPKKAKREARQATTGHSGEAILSFAPMGEPDDDLELTVVGTLSDAKGDLARDEVDGEIDIMDRTTVRVEMDKPLHKPGEVVHLRAIALGDNGRAMPNEPETVTVKDPDDKTLAEVKLTTDRFGIVQYDWKTTEQTQSGDYDVSFDLDNATSSESTTTQTVRIQRYDLPEFSVTATPDRPYYLEGQMPQLKIHAAYLFGKPVSIGSVRVVSAENTTWNWKTNRYDEPADVQATATLDANGDATLPLPVAAQFSEMKESDWERYRDLTFRAMVTDATTGRTEPRRFAVRLTREPVHIYFNPLGSDEREGEYLLSTTYADGTPTPCHVTVDWMDAESRPSRALSVTTNHYGLAKVTLRFAGTAGGDDPQKPHVRITARDKEGRLSHFDDSLYLSNPNDIWISLDHSLLAPEQAIEGTLHGKPGELVDLDVLSEGSALAHLQVRMLGREQEFTIPARPSFRGRITLRAYSMRVEMERNTWYLGNRGGERTVLYPEDRSLLVNVKGLAAQYPPGAAVTAGLELRNAGNGPAAGVFGVSVFDTAVEQRAETELEANDRWFGQSWWWLLGRSVGDVTLETLNKTDMSQPVSSELDLAAEAVLMDFDHAELEITSTDESEVRGQYEEQIKRAVKPLGDAILKANPESLPSSAEDLKKFSAGANFSEAILLDPWNTPYQAKLGEEYDNDVVTLTSAGPDKQFGTDDDFSIPLVERNLFAIPGERLNKLLEQAVAAGQPLPATVEALKKFALAGGLNLDSAAQHTLQRNGKPYIYEINELHSYYTIDVQRSSYDHVWQTKGLNYFKHTEERLNSALEKWTAAGNAFPETDADALRAFVAADIDFSKLRDPLGRPFAVATKRESSFARIDNVKGGTTTGGGTQKVTTVIAVIQILRTDEKGARLDSDEVARFTRMISQQSGSDAVPVPVDSMMFKGNTGAIGGTVTDATGAVIPNAKVSVENQSGGANAITTTKGDGSYVVPDLEPGYYKVKISARGFEAFFLTDVHVSSSALTTIDAKLSVGAETLTVTVSATEEVVPVESAEVVSTSSGGLLRKNAKGSNGSAVITEQTMTPRLRHVFAETAYWAPSLETNSSGRAALKFTLPDNLTTWKLHATGSTIDGRITAIDQMFKTFMPFMVDLDTPQTLTVGDTIWPPVNLRNYMDHSISLPVTVKPADWFTLTTPTAMHATVASNGSTPVVVGLRASAAVDAGPLRITAANAHEGDAIEKTVKVHPDGEPRMITSSELLHGGGKNTVALDLPADAIAGSVHAELLLYPNLGANVYHAMKAVLERPYGCAEQTISSTYPSLLFLEMETAAKHESATKEQAQAYVQLGYDRLMGYFNPAGGLTYWGGNDTHADAALTAYGVEFLTEAKPYVKVDQAQILSAIEWLLAQQDKDGAWKPRYGEYSARQSLYIASELAYVLRTSDFRTAVTPALQDRVKQAIAHAEEYATHSVMALHDPYANALRLNLAAGSGDAQEVARLRKELIATVQDSRDGAYWEFDGFSPFYGWGTGGRLEITALALAAFNASGNEADKKLEDDTLLYLLRNRDGYGVWMSGQATVRVLKALLPIAVQQLQNPVPGDFVLTVNGTPLGAEQAAAMKADSQISDAPRSIDLTSMIHAGTNTLEFSGTSGAALANAQLTARFYVPWAQAIAGKTKTTVPGKDFGLDFGYQCDAAAAKVGQPITCTVNARRFGSESYGMMLAEVGLPPGADVDRASLGKLLDNWTIYRYDLEPDRIVFYLWSSAAEGEKFSFRFTPRYAIRAKAAPAKLTDYYNPDLNAVLAPQLFDIGEMVPH